MGENALTIFSVLEGWMYPTHSLLLWIYFINAKWINLPLFLNSPLWEVTRVLSFVCLSVCLSVSLTNFVYFSLYYQFYLKVVLLFFFFSIWVFFHEHSRFTGQQEKREGICLTPLYHFHPLHRHLYISRATAAGSSPLRIGSSRTRIGNPWLPSASC